jgi:hypothetical protein
MDGNRYGKEFRVQRDGNADMAKGSETDMDWNTDVENCSESKKTETPDVERSSETNKDGNTCGAEYGDWQAETQM